MSLALPRKPSTVGRDVIALLVAAAVVASVVLLELKWNTLRRLPGALWRYSRLMFGPPDWGYAQTAWNGVTESIQIAWFGTLIAAVVSLPLGMLAARQVGPAWVRVPLRQLFNVIRAVPELVLAILFIPLVGLGAFSGTLAIGIHSIGTLAKLTFEATENVRPGPEEAARAVGGSRAQVVRWAILPQAMPEILAFWLYRFEVNLRASAVLGLVGAGGVGAQLANTINYRRWDKVGMLILVIVAATVVIDAASGALRRRIISGSWRTSGGAVAASVAPDALAG